MAIIKWDGREYWQDGDGVPVLLGNYLEGCDYIDDLYNPHLADLPRGLNTTDPALTCPRCATAYRRSEARAGACPYCHYPPPTDGSSRRGARSTTSAQGSQA